MLKAKNPCIICGKERVVIKTYTEKVDGATYVVKLSACPDPACQKKVDAILAKEKSQRQGIKEASARRELERVERVKQSHKKAN